MPIHRQVLIALTALALPALAQASPSAQAMSLVPGIVATQPSSLAVKVANQRRPYHAVNRHNDRGNDTGDAQVEQLNQMSLQRAQQGQNALGPNADTTSNLNNMSDQDAMQGRNTGSKPLMPFR
jgi:hypothetical protein